MTSAKPKPPLIPGETRAYPVLPLRDIVVFPHMIVPLFVGREKSIKALEEVMRSDTFILLATQRNASDDDPATAAIYEVGTLASVLQEVGHAYHEAVWMITLMIAEFEAELKWIGKVEKEMKLRGKAKKPEYASG